MVVEAAIPTVQALIGGDPVGHARPSDRPYPRWAAVESNMAAVDGAGDAAAALLRHAELPEDADVFDRSTFRLGCAGSLAAPAGEPAIRDAARVGRDEGLALAVAAAAATAIHSARNDHEAVRVQIDPLHIG